MPWRSMNSIPRVLALTIGCQQADRARHQGQLLELVAAIGDISGYRVVLACVREGFVVERLEDDLDLLLEQFAVSLLVDDRRTERFYFAAVIAAADAEYSAALGQDVSGGVILGETQRVPHRRDIEAATIRNCLVMWARCTAHIR